MTLMPFLPFPRDGRVLVLFPPAEYYGALGPQKSVTISKCHFWEIHIKIIQPTNSHSACSAYDPTGPTCDLALVGNVDLVERLLLHEGTY